MTKEQLTEALDAVLQQQFLSSDGSILNRTKRESVKIPGTKITYIRIRNAIMSGFHFILGERMDKFTEYLSTKFQVPENIFDEKLASLGDMGRSIDKRMKFIMIISAMREYWQDFAYQKVLEDLKNVIINISGEPEAVSTGDINAIVSSQFGSDFSMLVNIYVLKEMGRLAGNPVKTDDAWYQMIDKLATEVLVKVMEDF
ncbi:MAG: hypothetical protein ACFFCS_19525 [Candidatus Hodarchaeota archaeon]